MVSQETIEAISAFTTCDVADALQKFQVPQGGFLSGLTMWSPERQNGSTRIVGPAYTVKYVLNEDDDKSKPSEHYVDTIPSGSVVFISAPPDIVNAVYGGLMATRAQYSGAVGTIVDGRIRDLQEHRDLNYPVFAREVGTSAPAEVVRVSAINGPVALRSPGQQTTVNPGDILVADLNGVVCIPAHLADQLPELMESQAAADEKIAEEIKKGVKFAEASKKHRGGVRMPRT